MEVSDFLLFTIVSLVTINLAISYFTVTQAFLPKPKKVKLLFVIWLIPFIGALIILLIILTLKPISKRKFKKGYKKVAVNDPADSAFSDSGDSD